MWESVGVRVGRIVANVVVNHVFLLSCFAVLCLSLPVPSCLSCLSSSLLSVGLLSAFVVVVVLVVFVTVAVVAVVFVVVFVVFVVAVVARIFWRARTVWGRRNEHVWELGCLGFPFACRRCCCRLWSLCCLLAWGSGPPCFPGLGGRFGASELRV